MDQGSVRLGVAPYCSRRAGGRFKFGHLSRLGPVCQVCYTHKVSGIPAIMLVIVSVVLALLLLARDRSSPVTWTLWMWVAIGVVQILQPISLASVTGAASAICGIGLLCLALPTIIFGSAGSTQVNHGEVHSSYSRYVVITVIFLVLGVIAAVAFQDRIATIAGSDFGSLSAQQVRLAQNSRSQTQDALGILSVSYPILACLGVFGAVRYAKVWILVAVAALALTLPSPARTQTLSVAVSAVVFWLYIRGTSRVIEAPSAMNSAPRKKRFPWVWIMALLVIALIFFNAVGASLSKTGTGVESQDWLPQSLVSPVAYFAAGVPALGVALSSGVNPFDWGTSVYSILRIAHVFSPEVQVPNTIGAFVYAPMPFNVYTGFGQTYFDLGLVGLIVLFVVFGGCVRVAHGRASSGQVQWAWVCAVATAVLLSLPQAFRGLALDIDVEVVVGFVVMKLLVQPKEDVGHSVGGQADGKMRSQLSTRGV